MFDDLEDEGHFYDPLAKEVKEVFLPWLMEDVVRKVDKAVDSMAVVDGTCCQWFDKRTLHVAETFPSDVT